MKKLVALLFVFIVTSCGLQPDPSWAPSPKPTIETRTLNDVVHPNNIR